MKSILAAFALLVPAMVLHAQDKAALAGAIAVFNEIDARFKDWPHYSCSMENLGDGQSCQQQVWKSDYGQHLVKVETLTSDAHGVTNVQYHLKGGRLLFTLERTETTLKTPKSPTDVFEKRYYFAADGQLIRLLEKKGEFPAGAPTDTVGFKNREVPLNAEDDTGETYIRQHKVAAAVMERLQKLEPDPAADEDSKPATLTGEGWRMISGSASRDGRYALAWGLKGKEVIVGEDMGDGTLSVDPDDPDLLNYVVNLQNRKIVGPLQGRHFGDRERYNHMTNETEWSGDCEFVAQICDFKWYSASAFVYQLRDGASVSPGVDLIAPATTAVFKKLKGSPYLRKFTSDDFAITLSEALITRRVSSAVLQVTVSGVVPKNGEDHSSFECTVTFELSPAQNGGAPVLKWLDTELNAD